VAFLVPVVGSVPVEVLHYFSFPLFFLQCPHLICSVCSLQESWSRDSVGSMVEYGNVNPMFESQYGNRFFSSPIHQTVSGAHCRRFNWYFGSSSDGKEPALQTNQCI